MQEPTVVEVVFLVVTSTFPTDDSWERASDESRLNCVKHCHKSKFGAAQQ